MAKRRPKGSGTIRQTSNGWMVGFGPRIKPHYESGFRTRLEAEQRLTLLRAESLQRRLGVAVDPRFTPTLGELASDWLKRRKQTHRSGDGDGYRWKRHLAPALGHLKPDQVDTARIRALVEAKRSELKPATIRVVLSVLSSFYEDLLERNLATRNPARHLPKSLLRLVRSDHDPRTTPFIERLDDVRRIFLAMEAPLSIAYAIGALAGLRTGEVFALRWIAVDLVGRRILVTESIGGPTKDKDPRPVPILDPLLMVLKAWKVESGGTGLVIPPLRRDGSHVDAKHTPGKVFARVLDELGLSRPGLGWYQATRHTFASQWAMAGRPLRELQAILGHSSIAVTERYAHLAPDYWAPGVHSALAVDLSPGGAPVTDLPVPDPAPRMAPKSEVQRRNSVVSVSPTR